MLEGKVPPMLHNDPGDTHCPVDGERLDLVEEFGRSPRGPHSAELQKVLHRMRWSGIGGRCVLITVEPGRRWMLGRLPERRDVPIETFLNRIYGSTVEAEWDVFCLRWEALTGWSISA
jgi:hypothetical protein